MLEPLAVDPNRSVAPAANNIASARLVFPAPAGPTSAITRVPWDGCPAMRLSLRAVTGARVASHEGARAPSGNLYRPPVFGGLQEGSLRVRRGSARNVFRRAEVVRAWLIPRDIKRLRRGKCRGPPG